MVGRAGQKVEPFQRLSRSYIKVPFSAGIRCQEVANSFLLQTFTKLFVQHFSNYAK